MGSARCPIFVNQCIISIAVESPAKYLVVQVFGLYAFPDEAINRLVLKKLREQVQSPVKPRPLMIIATTACPIAEFFKIVVPKTEF